MQVSAKGVADTAPLNRATEPLQPSIRHVLVLRQVEPAQPWPLRECCAADTPPGSRPVLREVPANNNKRGHICVSQRQTGRSPRQSPWKTHAKSLAQTDPRSHRSTRTLELGRAT